MPEPRKRASKKIVKYVPTPHPPELGLSPKALELTAEERALLRYEDARSPKVRKLLESKGMAYFEVTLDRGDADEIITVDSSRVGLRSSLGT